MFFFIDYFSTKRRLKILKNSITVLRESGIKEESLPIDLLAQKDFVEMEVEFFKNYMQKEFAIVLIGILLSVILFYVYYI